MNIGARNMLFIVKRSLYGILEVTFAADSLPSRSMVYKLVDYDINNS